VRHPKLHARTSAIPAPGGGMTPSGWAFGFNRNFSSIFAVFEQIRSLKMVTEIGMKI
jgi:hypothetical protein